MTSQTTKQISHYWMPEARKARIEQARAYNAAGAGTKIPAAACGTCGGWHSSGGMSQYANFDVPVDGRIGCICRRETTRF